MQIYKDYDIIGLLGESMCNLKIIERLKLKLTELFKNEDTGHDISHLERVLNYALQIQKHEGGDLYVIAVSALIHDIHRLLSSKYQRYISPKESLDEVKNILLACDVNLNKLNQILSVVKNHEDKSNKNFSLETLIVQDADALDALGEIGIERTLKYCKKNKIPLTSNEPLDCPEYIPDINPISTCHYVYRTMIPNGNKLFTKTARDIAKDKIQILEDFVKSNYCK